MKENIQKMVELCKSHESESTKCIASFIVSMRYSELKIKAEWNNIYSLDYLNLACLKFLINQKLDGHYVSEFIQTSDIDKLKKIYFKSL